MYQKLIYSLFITFFIFACAKEEPELNITNLMEHMETIAEHEDPAEVKVVVNKKQNALYFSREPIPSRKKGISNIPMLKQVCIIPFRRDFLIEYNDQPEMFYQYK